MTLGVLAGLGVSRASDLTSQASERTRVTALASQYAVDFTSIDYRHVQADIDAGLKESTAAFGPRFRATIQVLAPSFLKAHSVQITSVARAGLESFTPTSAIALVALNSNLTSTQAPKGVQNLFRVQISMQKVGGRWLASNLRGL